ncbi:MAG: helix-turn-helix transcriptional regulator [Deltaproteobacteria bacterium]|nr:helix-turn-helix transcriptional regulator [Deltaproteobacteria bacterium]
MGRRIRALRQKRGWQQVDLEAHLEGAATRSSVSYLENGRIFPSRDTLHALARAFEVPAAALVLDPADRRQRIALAILDCDEDLLPGLEKLVDAGESDST